MDSGIGDSRPRVSARHRVGAYSFFVYPLLCLAAGIASLVEGSIAGFLLCLVGGLLMYSVALANWRFLHRHGSDDWRFSWTAVAKRGLEYMRREGKS